MHPDIATALRLQELDTRIAQLKAEIDLLPRHIARIERQLESHLKQLEVDRAALTANQHDRKKHEADIQTHNQKISKLRDQMLEAKNNEQYRAFQHEIEFGETAIRKSEDRILELMTESEKLEANVKTAEAALAQEKAVVDKEKRKAQQATTKDKAELQTVLASRAASYEKLPSNFRAMYDRLRLKLKDHKPISEAVDGRCSACMMTLRPQLFQDLKQNDGNIILCESCKRVLYYHAPVNLESAIDELPKLTPSGSNPE
jgi:uncharacterized protein